MTVLCPQGVCSEDLTDYGKQQGASALLDLTIPFVKTNWIQDVYVLAEARLIIIDSISKTDDEILTTFAFGSQEPLGSFEVSKEFSSYLTTKITHVPDHHAIAIVANSTIAILSLPFLEPIYTNKFDSAFWTQPASQETNTLFFSCNNVALSYNHDLDLLAFHPLHGSIGGGNLVVLDDQKIISLLDVNSPFHVGVGSGYGVELVKLGFDPSTIEVIASVNTSHGRDSLLDSILIDEYGQESVHNKFLAFEDSYLYKHNSDLIVNLDSGDTYLFDLETNKLIRLSNIGFLCTSGIGSKLYSKTLSLTQGISVLAQYDYLDDDVEVYHLDSGIEYVQVYDGFVAYVDESNTIRFAAKLEEISRLVEK